MIGIPGGGEEQETETLLENIMTENFSNLERRKTMQVQEP